MTLKNPDCDHLNPPRPNSYPRIDINAVTYNNKRWITAFVDSLMNLDYPLHYLVFILLIMGPTDDTPVVLKKAKQRLQEAGYKVVVLCQPHNHGYGAGQNAAMKLGDAPFCLVTNIDLVFEKSSIRYIAEVASSDDSKVAAWELRQKPYEHPKFYDPVTGLTNWNACACVLYRREALEKVGGFDTAIFMYCEDVELSYKLRREGHLLRYCPLAVVWHRTHEESQSKMLMHHISGMFGNFYLRLKYGTLSDIFMMPFMAFNILMFPDESFPGVRLRLIKCLLKLAVYTPKALLSRRISTENFNFRGLRL